MNRVIFLDIDGVLNSEEYYKSRQRKWDGEFRFIYDIDSTAIERLNNILDKTQAQIVLSSSWRFAPLNEIMDSLKYKGFKYDIKYITTKERMDRGLQILKFVNENNVKDYIVIDDEPFEIVKYIPSNQFVNTTSDSGLLQEHVDYIIEYFNKKVC